MRTGFVSAIGPLRVERLTGVQRTNSAIDLSKPPTGGGHTTEGSFSSALSVFRSRLTCPHLMVDGKRVGQGVPFGEMAASFAHPAGTQPTNGWCRCQIEVVAFSKESLWLPSADTVDSLAHILVWCKENLDIPLRRPFASDDLGPKPWATTTYARRRAGKWGNEAGWFMHVEIPANSHWDMGMYRWSMQMQRALELAKGVTTRTLILQDPVMRGADVVEAKHLLAENPYGQFLVGNFDQAYGREAAQTTFAAKKWLGYPRASMNTAFGPVLRAYLKGDKPLPADYKRRRATRLAAHIFRQPVVDGSVVDIHQ